MPHPTRGSVSWVPRESWVPEARRLFAEDYAARQLRAEINFQRRLRYNLTRWLRNPT